MNLGRFAELGNAATEPPALIQQERSVERCVVSFANAKGQQKVNNPAPEDAKMPELIWLN